MKRRIPAGGSGGEHRQRSRHIAGFERRFVRRVDDPGDVDHRVALRHQPLKRVAVFEAALDPFDALARHPAGAAPALGPGAHVRLQG